MSKPQNDIGIDIGAVTETLGPFVSRTDVRTVKDLLTTTPGMLNLAEICLSGARNSLQIDDSRRGSPVSTSAADGLMRQTEQRIFRLQNLRTMLDSQAESDQSPFSQAIKTLSARTRGIRKGLTQLTGRKVGDMLPPKLASLPGPVAATIETLKTKMDALQGLTSACTTLHEQCSNYYRNDYWHIAAELNPQTKPIAPPLSSCEKGRIWIERASGMSAEGQTMLEQLTASIEELKQSIDGFVRYAADQLPQQSVYRLLGSVGMLDTLNKAEDAASSLRSTLVLYDATLGTNRAAASVASDIVHDHTLATMRSLFSNSAPPTASMLTL